MIRRKARLRLRGRYRSVPAPNTAPSPAVKGAAPLFLDTTILSDATLGVRARRMQTNAVLATHRRKTFPQYAAKEFKAGPLAAYVLFNNILAEEKSIERTVGRLDAIYGTPRRNLFRTALQAYRRAAQETDRDTGKQFTHDELPDEYRRHTKKVIFLAWKNIFKLGEMTHALECHSLSKPRAKGPVLIDLDDRRCDHTGCALARQFHARKQELQILARIVESQPSKPENDNRLAALEDLLADRNLNDSGCRHLGDAVFALLAPTDFVILTTNVRDHRPLAQALGKDAISPAEVR
jgi:hypothetical protein